jgi:hypothetical protein
MTRLTGMRANIFAPLRTRSLRAMIHPNTRGWCYVDEVVFDLSDRPTPQDGPISRYYQPSLTLPVKNRTLEPQPSNGETGLAARPFSSAARPNRAGSCGQHAVERCDNLCSLADGGRDPLHRAGPHVTDGEDAAPTCFQRLTIG